MNRSTIFAYLIFIAILSTITSYSQDLKKIPKDYELTPEQMRQYGLTANYCKRTDMRDCYTRIDRKIEIMPRNAGQGTIINVDGFPSEKFSIVWTGQILIPEDGTWTFIFDPLDDDVQLFIDNEIIINDRDHDAAGPARGSVSLTSGYHDIRVQYQDYRGAQAIVMKWQKGTGATSEGPIEVIPIAAFKPTEDPYIEALKSLDKFLIKHRTTLTSEAYSRLREIYTKFDLLINMSH